MEIIQEGHGELVGWRDPDEHRQWMAENKSRRLLDKRMSATEAVSRFVADGDFLVSGGFGHVRVSMALIYEIIRQRKRGLVMAGKTGVHDSDILIAAGCVDRIEVAYAFGHEMRGLSPASRRALKEGKVRVVAETSNAAYQWRFLAGMMGLPFIPSRNLLGTDTLEYSSAKVVNDPFTGRPICLLPAAYPDVALIHVHRCDQYGNCQVDGIAVEDYEIARSARRLLVSTEKVISEEEIRSEPWKTIIPFYLVDAVVEAPGGAHPCQMAYCYSFDEDHIKEWLTLSRTPEGTQEYFDRYVYGPQDSAEYLELVGGSQRLAALRLVELGGRADG
jgi:3-oxoacid CoA-transferase subunit A/glutaconate CoA-transferase subunit A